MALGEGYPECFLIFTTIMNNYNPSSIPDKTNPDIYINSFTNHKQHVGLDIRGKFLKQANEIVLVWPFKNDSKSIDNFYHATLEQDEISQFCISP